MKKSTFIGNLAVWVVAAAACCAFLAWWNLGNGTPDISDPLVQLGVVLAGTPALLPDAGEALLGPAVVVVYVTMVAPLLIMMLGFVYAIGCAGVDTSKRGPFAKYLPDDHFDE